MKFKFNLEKVLKHRKTLENLAQISFQEALSELKNEERVLEQMKNQLLESRNQLILKINNNCVNLDSPLGEYHQLDHFIKLQTLRIERQQAKIQNIEKQVENKREILRNCATESKIMERLKEKKHGEYLKEQIRIEQNEMDELALLLNVRDEFRKV